MDLLKYSQISLASIELTQEYEEIIQNIIMKELK